MANVGDLTATLRVRDENFASGMDRAADATRRLDRASSDLRDQMVRQANTMAIVAGAAMVAFGKTAISAAVDAEEAASAFATSFGPAAESAGQFVEGFANKAGMANYELQQMMAVTGSVVQGLGATEGESAALSERMVTLAGDIASFSNAQGGTQAVMAALQSAINGERESLKTYGLALSEAEVQQKAFEMTGKSSVDELTRMDKALATVELAYGKASKAVGDLDRTQESSANQLRQVRAGFEELKVSVGDALLPIVGGMIPALKGMMDFAARVPAVTTALGAAVVTVGAAAAAAKLLGLELSAARMAALGLVGAIAGLVVYGVGQRTIMDDWREALERLAPAVMAGGESIEAMRDRLIELGFSAGDIDPLIRRMRDELPAAIDTVNKALESAVRDMFPDWIAAAEDTDDTSRDLGEDYDQLTEQFRRHARAVDESTRSLQELADEQRAAVDPVFGMMSALDDAAQAQRDYTAALATDDIAAMEQAEIDAMNALMAFDTAAADFDMTAAIETVRSMGARLHWSDEQTQGWIDRIIALNSTNILDKSFTITAFMHDVTGAGPLLGGRQHGGPVFPGSAAIVGEAGPELLTVTGAGAMVTPFSKLPKLADGGKLSVGFGKGSEYAGMKGVGKISALYEDKTSALYHGDKTSALYGMSGGMPAWQISAFQRMGWALPQMMQQIAEVKTAVGTATATAAAGLAAPHMTDSGNTTTINVYVTVEGSIRSDRDLAKVVEAELVRAVRRGGTSDILT